ncbi:4'-phosphopantetheinyl transferase family protein [Streptomyces sp. NPDC004327]|uniref:4'-phosphopantetheinyl transferase family protein n=1 Tax=unclassified Streptomyces TaxID=2593676 RepID=UPI00367A824C
MQAEAWLLELPEHARTHTPAPDLDTSTLDARERERAAAFLRPADRRLYTAAHLALRAVLGRLLGERPGDLVFAREPCPCCGAAHGRPVLAVPEPPVHFSLSHTEGRVLIATAPVPVGADVERAPGPPAVRDLLPALHPRERSEVEAAADPERAAAVLGRVWARKEAYLKGIGTGLGRSTTLDDLGGDPAREPGRHPAGWSVYDLPCGPRHHGALAVRAARPADGAPRLHLLASPTEIPERADDNPHTPTGI